MAATAFTLFPWGSTPMSTSTLRVECTHSTGQLR
jgi:hypothetical protein